MAHRLQSINHTNNNNNAKTKSIISINKRKTTTNKNYSDIENNKNRPLIRTEKIVIKKTDITKKDTNKDYNKNKIKNKQKV